MKKLDASAGTNAELQALMRQGKRRLEAIEAKDLSAFTNAVLEAEEFEDLIPTVHVTCGVSAPISPRLVMVNVCWLSGILIFGRITAKGHFAPGLSFFAGAVIGIVAGILLGRVGVSKSRGLLDTNPAGGRRHWLG